MRQFIMNAKSFLVMLVCLLMTIFMIVSIAPLTINSAGETIVALALVAPIYGLFTAIAGFILMEMWLNLIEK